MSFQENLVKDKAVEFGEYTVALFKYKEACKRFALIRKKYKYSTVPKERLVYYEARDAHSAACKEYNQARAKWERCVIEYRLRTDYIDQPDVIARILEVKTPLGFMDLKKEHENNRIAESFSPEEFEKAKAMALKVHREYEASKDSTKQSVMDSLRESIDPTAGDFKPLP